MCANREGGPDGKRALDALVNLCSRPLPVVGGIKHTELWSRSEGVDAVNAQELRALPSELVCACSTSVRCMQATLRYPQTISWAWLVFRL